MPSPGFGWNGVEKRLCLRDVASQLKALGKKTDDGGILRTQITGSPEVFLRGDGIAHCQISQRRIGE